MRCLFVPVQPDKSTRSWSSAHTGQSVNKPPPPEEATADQAFATGHQQSVAAWEDTGSLTPPPPRTSSAAPRAVKMPTFGRVVVVFASPFWQASPSDRNKSPLTLIAKKCGRYSPLSCACSTVCVCVLCQMRRGLTSGFSQWNPPFQFPVVPSGRWLFFPHSCSLLSSRSPFLLSQTNPSAQEPPEAVDSCTL